MILVVGVFAINVAESRLFDALLILDCPCGRSDARAVAGHRDLNLTRGARALTAHGVLSSGCRPSKPRQRHRLCTTRPAPDPGQARVVKAVRDRRKDDAGEAVEGSRARILNSHFELQLPELRSTLAVLAAGTEARTTLDSYKNIAELPYDSKSAAC